MRFSIPLLALLVMLAACTAPVEEAEMYQCPDGTRVMDVADCPAAPSDDGATAPDDSTDDSSLTPAQRANQGLGEGESTTEQIFGSDEQATAPVSGDLQELRDRFADKAPNGYSVIYERWQNSMPSQHPVQAQRVYVRDGVYAVDLGGTEWLEIDDTRATHLIGMPSEDTITAYCVKCRNTPFEREVDSSLLDIRLPHEWLASVSGFETGGTRTLSGRSVLDATGMIDGEEASFAIDTFSGLPVLVEMGDVEWRYSGIRLGVKDADFAAPE